MKDLFRGYYPPSDDELNAMWEAGLIILDTNALLNLFRYSEATRGDFLAVLHDKADSLWIPFHVGLEFHRGRRGVIAEQEAALDDVQKAITSAENTVDASLRALKDHPSLDIDGVRAATAEGLAGATEQVSLARRKHEDVVRSRIYEQTLDEITELYEGRVGQPWDEKRLTELYAVGSKRYERKVPPGFADKKAEPDKYGDLVIWMQILEHAASQSRPVIFVTDDGKEDWWYKIRGETIGPRPELVAEFAERVGARVHLYPPQRFVEFAKRSGAKVSDASVEEVGTVSSAHQLKTATSDSGVEHTIRGFVDEFGESHSSTFRRQLLERHRLLRLLMDEVVDPSSAVPIRENLELLRRELDQIHELEKIMFAMGDTQPLPRGSEMKQLEALVERLLYSMDGGGENPRTGRRP